MIILHIHSHLPNEKGFTCSINSSSDIDRSDLPVHTGQNSNFKNRGDPGHPHCNLQAFIGKKQLGKVVAAK